MFMALCACSFLFSQSARPIGVNLAATGNYASQVIFVDVMKQSSSWFALSSDFSNFNVEFISGQPVHIPLRDDGYPRYAPVHVAGDSVYPNVLMLNAQPAPWHYPAGDYRLEFEGTGMVGVQWDVANGPLFFTQPDTAHSVPVTPTSLGLNLVIFRSDSLDPIRNIRFVLPGHENTYDNQPYNPAFFDILGDFEVLRFMKPLADENNALSAWADRTTLDHHHYWSDNEGEIRRSMPYEHVIRICNEANKSCWLNIPVGATNPFVDSLARMFRDDMDSSLTIYLEYSNETWNPGYWYTHGYVNDTGVAMGLHSDPFTAGQRFHVLRSMEIFQRFDSVFAGQTQRLYSVICQQPWDVPGRIMIDAIGDSTINPNGYLPDAISVATYFGTELLDELVNQGLECTLDAQDILDSLAVRLPQEMADMVPPFRFWADSLGIDLVNYEGGQYLVRQYGLMAADSCSLELIRGANRDPRMADIYCQFYDLWYDTYDGDMHIAFNLAEAYLQHGASGLLESVWQDTATAPKYGAHHDCVWQNTLLDINNSMPAWYESPLEGDWELKAGPNPVRETLKVSGDAKGTDLVFRLSDLQGRQLGRRTLANAERFSLEFDMRGLPAGLYFMQVRWATGQRTIRLLKE